MQASIFFVALYQLNIAKKSHPTQRINLLTDTNLTYTNEMTTSLFQLVANIHPHFTHEEKCGFILTLSVYIH